MKNPILNIAKLLMGWPLSIIALFFIFKLIFLKTNEILPSLKDLNIPIILISIVCFLGYFFLRSYVWKKILQEKGHNIPFKDSTLLWSLAEIKRFIPGNIWSFLSRTSLFSGREVPTKTIISSLITEAQLFVVSSLLVSIFSFSFVFYNLLPNLLFTRFLIYLADIFIILSALLFIFNAQFIKRFRTFSFLKKMLPDFSAKTNLTLLLISVINVFFFGLGTYFSISSVIYLSPIHIVTFISFFTFSFLIGYLSIITPMGLGVREGMITFGLSKFISVSIAGFASIFSRIVMIFSELIFLLLAFLWKYLKIKFVEKIENKIKAHPHESILLVMIIMYFVYFTALSFLRYDNFFTGRFDLGNMDQTVWNTTKGRIFQLTDPNGTQAISRLAFHADFILILISPLYFIWSNPKMLLLIQTLVVGFGAIFIYWIAKNLIKNKNISLAFSLTYLLNPSIQYANLYDFHAVTLATTFLLATFYFFWQKQYKLFLLFAVLSAFTKEQVWVIISLFGFYFIYLSLRDKTNKILNLLRGFTIITLCFAVFYYLVWIIIPQTRGQNHFALSYYSDFGTTPTSIIKNIIIDPLKTLQIIGQNGRLMYLGLIFLPLGFLSIFSPFALVFALPDLFINMLSNNSQLHEIYYQYTSTITPFLFISAIYGLRKLMKIFPKIPDYIYMFFLLACALFSSYSFGPVIGSKNPNLDMITKPQPNKDVIEGFLSRIPMKYSIAATNNLGSHLSHRQQIFTIPVGIDKADIVLFLLNDPFAQPSLKAQIATAENLKKDKNYIEIFKQNDFIVFEKRSLYLHSPRRANRIKLNPFSIPTLQHRDYIGGEITVEKDVSHSRLFKSYIVSYPSDGLKINALMNVPNLEKPDAGFSVVIINHGYIDPKKYDTRTSYREITDYFASNGFIAIKPDYRGNADSEVDNEALMRFSYPVDILNLISSVKNLKNAEKNSIFLWGHSLGGEVTLKVLEVLGQNKELPQNVKAASVWAPVTDTLRWFSKSHLPSLPESNVIPYPYKKTFEALGTPESNPVLWQSLSPLSYFSSINIPIQINHGTSDPTVPYEWSIELYNDLLSLNKKANLLLYDNNGHNLSESWVEAARNSLNFFKNY